MENSKHLTLLLEKFERFLSAIFLYRFSAENNKFILFFVKCKATEKNQIDNKIMHFRLLLLLFCE